MKLVKKCAVPASLCDAEVKLSLTGAFTTIEDLVTEMMGKLHIDGVTCMREYGAMWVFVRNHIEMFHPLYWMDEYTAECYISSYSSVKLHVDTVLKNAAGETALFSRLELCAVDLETMKIRKADSVGVGEATPPENPEFDTAFAREKYVPEETLETVLVRSSDIDYCHHCNNISYIRYLVNRWTAEDLLKSPVRMIEVQYVNQTHEGDTLEICRCRKAPDSPESRTLYTILHEGKAAVNIVVERD